MRDDAVAQHADAIDMQFDRVAAGEKAADFEPAAIADGARAENLAGVDRLVLRGVGEELREISELRRNALMRWA